MIFSHAMNDTSCLPDHELARLLGDCINFLKMRHAFIGHLPHIDQVQMSVNRMNMIIEVVRDTGRQHTEAFMLLRDDDFFLVPLEIRDVDHGSHVPRVGAVFPADSTRA